MASVYGEMWPRTGRHHGHKKAIFLKYLQVARIKLKFSHRKCCASFNDCIPCGHIVISPMGICLKEQVTVGELQGILTSTDIFSVGGGGTWLYKFTISEKSE